MIVTSRNKVGLAKFKTGLWTYEKLGKVAEEEKHEILAIAELAKREPHLKVEGLVGAVQYPEYLTDDARLTLANVRSAVAAGAVVATYAAAEEILTAEGKACGAMVRGALPDETLAARIKAKLVVNAAGPWVDAIRQLEDTDAVKIMQLTKGIHVVIPKSRLPVNNSVVMTTPDKRMIFTCPREDYVYLGTTDTFYPDADYVPEVGGEDIDYLLETANSTFDVEPLKRADIVSIWSGVRPLIGEEGKTPSQISRKDEILEGSAGVLTLAGGKLTAYRVMAEKLIDLCEKKLGRTASRCATADSVLPGGDLGKSFTDFQADLLAKGLTATDAERLLRLYGTESLLLTDANNSVDAEVKHAVSKEGALTLEDYWIRRSARARFTEQGGLAELEQAADSMAVLLSWTNERRRAEVESCRAIRNRELAALAA